MPRPASLKSRCRILEGWEDDRGVDVVGWTVAGAVDVVSYGVDLMSLTYFPYLHFRVLLDEMDT